MPQCNFIIECIGIAKCWGAKYMGAKCGAAKWGGGAKCVGAECGVQSGGGGGAQSVGAQSG